MIKKNTRTLFTSLFKKIGITGKSNEEKFASYKLIDKKMLIYSKINDNTSIVTRNNQNIDVLFPK